MNLFLIHPLTHVYHDLASRMERTKSSYISLNQLSRIELMKEANLCKSIQMYLLIFSEIGLMTFEFLIYGQANTYSKDFN